MTDIIPGLHYPITREDIRNPQRLTDPKRVAEAEKVWSVKKVDDDRYLVSKIPFWAGAVALATAAFLGILNGVKGLAHVASRID